MVLGSGIVVTVVLTTTIGDIGREIAGRATNDGAENVVVLELRFVLVLVVGVPALLHLLELVINLGLDVLVDFLLDRS